MTGPTFVRNTLILSVQHPSEDCIFDQAVEPAGALLHRPIELPHRSGVHAEPHRAARQQLAEQYRGKPEWPAPPLRDRHTAQG
jgi:secreted PhoX family phosphatase